MLIAAGTAFEVSLKKLGPSKGPQNVEVRKRTQSPPFFSGGRGACLYVVQKVFGGIGGEL